MRNKNDEYVKHLEETIIAGKKAREKGIRSKRPNEAGNKIESFVIESLREVGLDADKPKAKSGRKKASGYPDIKILYNDKVIYLDCKTYSSKTKEQTLSYFCARFVATLHS